jgi:hypothetical protein
VGVIDDQGLAFDRDLLFGVFMPKGWQKVPLVDSESLSALATADASAPAETETVDSTRAAREQPSAPPGDGE